MPRERYQTRLDEDIARDVDAYVARNDISQSEGMRRLVREGLESVNGDDVTDKIESDHEQILTQLNEIQESSIDPNKPFREQFEDVNSINRNIRLVGGVVITISLLIIFINELIMFI
ncbi:hypothetical protein [Haloquadratum walsbyi]|uniref:CopG domain protein n=1 Tax=Haloquadratum walsbyi (strain DSM 16854 / JCM 12705 / C23) TaxID=768065 RepID=G0LNF9_HALWC|nr:hypothetical protein [Haloquadratum walsbyi]CCC41965.1 conserved hypothetical protein [Haloquadratum walsbyi C23]